MDRPLPAGDFLRKHTSYVIEGEFYKPDTVLEVIAENRKIEDGIIEIMGPKLGGYLLIKNNAMITDAVVEETGETGTAAVCRLLLMPHGIFSFRKANPTDKPMYPQELNIDFDECKKFLQGPASIGLGFPGRNTLHNLKAITGETARKLTDPNYTGDGLEADIEEEDDYIGPEVVNDLKERDDYRQLVDAVSEKRRETMEIIRKEKQDQTTLEALQKPGPLPSRKQQEFEVDKRLVASGIVLFLGVIIASTVVNLLHNPHKAQKIKESVREATTTASKAVAPAPPKDSGSAPFSLPSYTPNIHGPSNTQPKDDKKKVAAAPDPALETIKQTIGAPTSTQVGNEEITKWLTEVRRNPKDIEARRELSQAYLIKGDTNSSIKEFYEVMKLKTMDSNEIINYANNLMVFGSEDLSKQFLRGILRSDPSRSAIRERLAEMR